VRTAICSIDRAGDPGPDSIEPICDEDCDAATGWRVRAGRGEMPWGFDLPALERPCRTDTHRAIKLKDPRGDRSQIHSRFIVQARMSTRSRSVPDIRTIRKMVHRRRG
jgi:hypothetical protein